MLDCIGKLVESINDFYNLTQAKSQELRKNGEENKRFRQFTRSISHNLINKFLGFKVPNSPLSNIGSRIRSMNDYEFSFSNTNLEEAIQILSKEKTVEAIEYTDHTIKNVIKGLGEVCSNLIEETQEFLYQDEEKARSELTDNQKIKLEEGGELKLVPDQKLRIFRYMREHKDEVTDLTTKYETWHFAGNAVTVE
jgi:hypothetical protein